jgi:hypothetical protein
MENTNVAKVQLSTCHCNTTSHCNTLNIAISSLTQIISLRFLTQTIHMPLVKISTTIETQNIGLLLCK